MGVHFTFFATSCLIRYDILDGIYFLDKSRPSAWSKLLALKALLPRYDWLAYLDADTVIMDPARRLESFLTSAEARQADFVMTEDWNGPNTGVDMFSLSPPTPHLSIPFLCVQVFLVRRSPFSDAFLEAAWTEGEPLVAKRSPLNGITYPFEFEQRAFHYLLQTRVWRERGLPVRPPSPAGPLQGLTAQQLLTHFYFLPQCAFNSYSLHPALWVPPEQRAASQYAPGDFLVHLAGKKGAMKTQMMQYYLSLSSSLRAVSGQAVNSSKIATTTKQR